MRASATSSFTTMAPRAVFTSQEPRTSSQILTKEEGREGEWKEREEMGGKGGGNTFLHLGNKFLIEQPPRLLMQRAINRNHITLRQHLLQILDSSTPDLLLDLSTQGLVIEIQQLLAIERL